MRTQANKWSLTKLGTSAVSFGTFYSAIFFPLLSVSANAAVLEEVIVTAQKRQQSLQHVGISVTAFSGEQMKALGFTNTVDLVAQTPGLNAVPPFGSANNVALTLRGVGLNDFSESNEAPVGVYLDGVYNATRAGIGFQLFDVERAEVLRGPQGTLYGRNTTGGLVHFNPKKPSQENEDFVELTLGEYGQKRFEGSISGGLTDALSARAAILYHQDDGYIENINPDIDDAGEADNFSGRLHLLYQQREDSEFLFSVHGGSADQVGAAYKHTASVFGDDGFDSVEVPSDVNIYRTCAGCDLTGYRVNVGDFYKTANDREFFIELDTLGYSMTVDWELGEYSFQSITAYEEVEKDFGEDTDAAPSPFIEVTNPVLSILDTEVEDINTGVSVIERELALSPDTTINALARHEWSALGETLSAQGDLQYVDQQFFDITNTTLGTEDSYTLGNLSATYLTGSGQFQRFRLGKERDG